jgi:hypothetical protein
MGVNLHKYLRDFLVKFFFSHELRIFLVNKNLELKIQDDDARILLLLFILSSKILDVGLFLEDFTGMQIICCL